MATQFEVNEAPRNSEFLNRVSEIGAVKSTWSMAIDSYEKAKQYNEFLRRTLETAEKTVTFAAGKAADVAKPMVDRFDGQITYADALACKTLDRLETSVEKTKTDGALVAATDLLNVTIGETFVVANKFLDQYLPPSDEEKKAEDGSLYAKIQNRIVVRTYNAVNHAAFAVDWVDFLQKHTNSTSAQVQTRLAEYRHTAATIYSELTSDAPPADDQQYAMTLARLVVQRLRGFYEHMPPVQPLVGLVQTLTSEVFTHLLTVTKFDDISSTVLQRARDQLQLLVSIIQTASSAMLKKA